MPLKPPLMTAMAKAMAKMPAMRDIQPPRNREQQLRAQKGKHKQEVQRGIQRGANMSGK